MRIVGFGSYDVSRHPRAGILLDGLAALGEQVEEINLPLGFSTAERVDMLQRPWTLARLVRRLVVVWAGLIRRGARAGAPDAVVVGYLGHFDVVLARLLFRRRTVVLDQLVFAADTARDRRARGWRVGLLGLLDRLAVGSADIVLVDTVEQLELLPPNRRARGLVVPVGAPRTFFGVARVQDTAPGPLRVVFFGLFTPLQGADVIGRALGILADHPEVAVTMIGTGQDLGAVRRAAATNEGVTWVPWLEPDRLPGALADADVCLGIFGTTPKALRVVPNKVFQGAAAGCAIVTSDTAPQRRALGDAAAFVPPGDPPALARVLLELAGDRDRLLALQVAARHRSSTAFTPELVAAPLRARLRERR